MNTMSLMRNQHLDFSSLRNIAVFRALQLGDLLCSVPALRALRRAAPQANITLIGLPWARSFAQRFSAYVDDYLTFPGFPGLPEISADVSALPSFFAEVQQRKFDLCIQLHGSGTLTNPLTVAFGAKANAGFFLPNQYCPDTRYFDTWLEKEHEVLRYLRLMEFLGIKTQGTELEFPLNEADYAYLYHCGVEVPSPGNYVCIHPGSRLPSRRWPSERFAEVADGLAALGLQVVVTGSQSERDITQAVIYAMRSPAIDMTGHTELGSLAALIAQARLVICNDTGISHIAAGVATPSVIICSGADPARWAPLNHERHRLLYAAAQCRPCAYTTCPMQGHPCAYNIEVTEVLKQAFQSLGLSSSFKKSEDIQRQYI